MSLMSLKMTQAGELDLRVLQVADLATLLATDAFETREPAELEDFLDVGHVRVHHSVKPVYDAITDREPEEMGMVLYSRGLTGLLMQVGTPLRKHFNESSWRISWGNYYTGWVDGIATVSSLEVARHFGKRHERVLDAARTLIGELPESAQHNFVLSEYRDTTGRALPIFRLTRDGFTLLAMGFTGPQALKFKLAYIDAFNRMEAELSKMYVEPLSNDKQFRKGVPMHLKFKLQEQGQKIMGLLVRAEYPAERRNLYWQLRQVNDALGIPTESMEALGIALPALEGGAA